MEDSINSNVVTIHLQHSPSLLSVDEDSISGRTAYSFSLSEETTANEKHRQQFQCRIILFFCIIDSLWLMVFIPQKTPQARKTSKGIKKKNTKTKIKNVDF